MLNAEWVHVGRVLAVNSGTLKMEPGMVIVCENRRYWVSKVLDPMTVEVLSEDALKVWSEKPDKFPIWRFLFLVLMIYFIVRVLL